MHQLLNDVSREFRQGGSTPEKRGEMRELSATHVAHIMPPRGGLSRVGPRLRALTVRIAQGVDRLGPIWQEKSEKTAGCCHSLSRSD